MGLLWACCGPEQLPHMGHFCACRMPCIGLLIALYVPVDFHMWASCLPHMRLLSASRGPHVGQTTATCVPHVGQRCKTRVAHRCALSGSYFNCHMLALCGPLVECLLGTYAVVAGHRGMTLPDGDEGRAAYPYLYSHLPRTN